MKKLLLIIVLFYAYGINCQNFVTVTKNNDGQTITLDTSQVLEIRLPSNPSTGYGWFITEIDTNVVKQIGKTVFEADTNNTSNLVLGKGGNEVIKIIGVAQGETELKLGYRRPWEMEIQPADTFKLTIISNGEYTGNYKIPIYLPQPMLLSGGCRTESTLPKEYSWQPWCTPVKNQGQCGSCWAFAACGQFEAIININDGNNRDLSEQWLINCATNNGFIGCFGCNGFTRLKNINGTYVNPIYHPNNYWNKPKGAVWENDSLKYTSSPCPTGEECRGTCEDDTYYTYHEQAMSNTDINDVLPSIDEIKEAIYIYGPVWCFMAVNEDINNAPIYKYEKGIYTTNDGNVLNHAVVLVGWKDTSIIVNQSDTIRGYWILRNSWGTNWGENGYMRIGYCVNGVGSFANYIEYKHGGLPGCTNLPTPSITVSDKPGCYSQAFTLSLQSLCGYQMVGFQWESSTVSSDEGWTEISGATKPRCVTSQTDSTWYRIRVSCSGDTVYSNVIYVPVHQLPTGTISGGGTVCSGEALPTLNISLNGDGPFSITYGKYANISLIEKNTIDGIQSNSYSVSNLKEGQYKLISVSDQYCINDNFSQTVTVKVNELPKIDSISELTVCDGEEVKLEVKTDCKGFKAFNNDDKYFRYFTYYDWDCKIMNILNLLNGQKMIKEGPNDYKETDGYVDGHFKVEMDCEGNYIITESTGNLNNNIPVSEIENIYKNSYSSTDPIWVSFGKPTCCCNTKGDKIFALLTGEITKPKNYKWTGPNGFYSEKENPTFTASANSAGIYTVEVTNEAGCKAIQTLNLKVYMQLLGELIITPGSQSFPNIDSVLTARVKPAGIYTYRWYKDGTEIEGAISSTYIPSGIGYYYCKATNSVGCVLKSNVVTVYSFDDHASIKGLIYYDNKDSTYLCPITVKLEISGLKITEPIILKQKKLRNKYYEFKNLIPSEQGYTYKLSCEIEGTDIKWGGANSTDGLMIMKNFVKQYSFKDTLKEKAGDVNLDGKYNSTDALYINKRYVSLLNRFKSDDWLFTLDKNQSRLLPDFIDINFDEIKNITAICAGDVDGSYINIPNVCKYEKSAGKSFQFASLMEPIYNCAVSTDSVGVKPGDTINVAVRMSEIKDAGKVGAFGFKIQYDTNVVAYKEIKDFGYGEIVKNRIADTLLMAWSAAGEENYIDAKDTIMFNLSFVYKGGESNISFLENCIVGDTAGNELNVEYRNGYVGTLVIKKQPESVVSCQSSVVSFEIEVSSGLSEMSYQWMKIVDSQQTTVDGATQSTYQIAEVDSTDAGDYYCVVTNEYGSVTSRKATLTVNTAIPTIAEQPVSVIGCQFSVVSFTVAEGSQQEAISYKWYKNNYELGIIRNNNLNNNELMSSQSSVRNYELTINSIDSTDAGEYYCEVGNTCGSVRSDTVTLTVNETPHITEQPVSVVSCSLSVVSFEVAIDSNQQSAVSYQWMKIVDSESLIVDSATQSTFTLDSIANLDAGGYYCVVSNEHCSVTSDVAQLEVISGIPDIIQQPESAEICQQSAISFEVAVSSGQEAVSYQWWKNSNQLSVTSNQLILNNVNNGDSGDYYCVVGNACGNRTSDTVILEVTTDISPEIEEHPIYTQSCIGGTANFSITTSGTKPQSYQWIKNDTIIINDATDSILTINDIELTDAGYYKCIVSNKCKSVTSKAALLYVLKGLTMIEQPRGDTLCEGENIEFAIDERGAYPHSYLWVKNGNQLSVNSRKLKIENAGIEDEGEYYCVVSNMCGSVTSSVVTLTVNIYPSISITQQPVSDTTCLGNSVTFSISATGTNLSYQWMELTMDNGQLIIENLNDEGIYTGTTSSTLNISDNTELNGKQYRCLISSGDMCVTTVTSESASLVINTQTHPWTEKSKFPGINRFYSVSFTIGTKTYLGTGLDSTRNFTNEFWEYDASNDLWTKKADFEGSARGNAAGFSIGSKGYLGTGYNDVEGILSDFWEYDPANDEWTQKSNIGNGTLIERAIFGATGFSIGEKGYVVSGYGNFGYTKSLWEYDPSNDLWTRKADFSGIGREGAVGFSINNKAYLGTGVGDNGVFRDFWEYNPEIDVWTKKADFAGGARCYAAGTGFNTNGYIGTGANNNGVYADFWEYNPVSDIWKQKVDIGGAGRCGAVSFIAGDSLYICTGQNFTDTTSETVNDNWKYSIKHNIAPYITKQAVSMNKCVGSDVVFEISADGMEPIMFQWMKNDTVISGATERNYHIAAISEENAGEYSCIISNNCSTITSNAVTLSVAANCNIKGKLISGSECADGIIYNDTLVLRDEYGGIAAEPSVSDERGNFMFDLSGLENLFSDTIKYRIDLLNTNAGVEYNRAKTLKEWINESPLSLKVYKVNLEWTQQYGNIDTSSVASAIDLHENIYVTGTSISSTGATMMTLIKYAPDGARRWVVNYGDSTTYYYSNGISIDNNSNIYVIGTQGGIYGDGLILKYDSTGTLLWNEVFSNEDEEQGAPKAIKTDKAGNVYVSGIILKDSNICTYTPKYYNCTVKYDSTGEKVWAKNYGKDDYTGKSFLVSMGIDSLANVYVASLNSNCNNNKFLSVIKYNTNGTELWSRVYNTDSLEVGNAENVNIYDLIGDTIQEQGGTLIDVLINYMLSIESDSKGNSYIKCEIGTNQPDLRKYIVMKYNNTGALRWVKYFGNHYIPSLTLDKSGDIYVTSLSHNKMDLSNYTTVIKYDNEGEQIWRVDTIESGFINYSDIDNSNNFYLFTIDDASQYHLIKLSNDGSFDWQVRGQVNNPEMESLGGGTRNSIKVSPNYNVYLIGKDYINSTYSVFATLKYSQCPETAYMLRHISGKESNSKNQKTNTNVNIYPNPNDGTFMVDLQIPYDGNVVVEAYNIIGSKVLSETQYLKKGLNTLNLKINNPMNGIYLIAIKTEKEVFNRKVVIR